MIVIVERDGSTTAPYEGQFHLRGDGQAISHNRMYQFVTAQDLQEPRPAYAERTDDVSQAHEPHAEKSELGLSA